MKRNHLWLMTSVTLLFAVMAACSFGGSSPPPPATVVPAIKPKATSPGAPAAGGGGCGNPYYPTTLGTTWSYSSTGSSLGDYTYTSTVADSSTTGFTTDTAASTGINAAIQWSCQAGNLAELNTGSDSLSLSSSSFKMTTNSTTATGYNVPNSFGSGKSWSENVTVDGTVVSGAKSVDSQILAELSCKAAGSESITVPAGTFKAEKATCVDTITISSLVGGKTVPVGAPSLLNITEWFARGVGLVKSVKVGATTGTNTTVLTEYHVK